MKKNFNRTIYTKQDAGAFFMLSLFTPQLLGTLFVFLILLVSIFSGIAFKEITSNPVVLIFLTISTQLSFLFVFLIYNKVFRFDAKKANKIYFKNGAKNIILAIVIGLVALYGFQYIVNFFDSLITFLNLPKSNLPLPLNTWYWLVINLFLLALLPAICEELVFRGVIFNGLMQYSGANEKKKNRVWIAVISSALLFALIHGSIEQTVYPIIFGIVLAILAYKTKSVIPCMVAHFVNNASVLVLNFLYETNILTASEAEISYDFRYYFMGIMFAFAAVLIIWLLSKFLTPSKQAKNLDVSPEINEEKSAGEIIQINHDIAALEQASKNKNVLLWIGVGFGVFFWILSLFS